MTITWAGRNRLTQGESLVAADADPITPEANTTYTIKGYIDGDLDNQATDIDAETYGHIPVVDSEHAHDS